MDHNLEVNALNSANNGFNKLFQNDVAGAKELFNGHDDPFHQLGLGVCAFLEAALGMETQAIEEANRCLTLAEAGTRKFTNTRQQVENHRFHPGVEWEILNADAVVLLGLCHALSETYMGYLQCLYSLNSAHSKFTKLFKAVFPNGVDSYLPSPPETPAAVSRQSSFNASVSYSSASSAATSTSTLPAPPETAPSPKRGFFSRLTTASTPALTAAHHRPHLHPAKPDGPVDDLVIAGTAFGYGLFNLIFSLLPKRIQFSSFLCIYGVTLIILPHRSVVGFFGFKHDRKLALKALAIAAAGNDTHSVFAGLVLMTYLGVILLMSGYQANEAKIVNEYKELVDRLYDRFPHGSLWILNKAKILRMTHDPDGTIRVLQEGLNPERPWSFAQADSLIVFELAWTLLGQRQYDEAAAMFLRMTELNTWSHATYYFIAGGCHWSLGDHDKAQKLFDAIPGLMAKKIGGKGLPTEVFLKKKIAFYKAKQRRLGKDEERFVEAITISPAEELAIFWNTHARISENVALIHIREWCSTSPTPTVSSPLASLPVPPTPNTSERSSPTPGFSTAPPTPPVLDTPDEFALRSLLLGIVHRTVKSYDASRAFLADAYEYQDKIENSTWIGGIAMFELAVLDLKEAEAFEAASRVRVGSLLQVPGTVNDAEGSKENVLDKWRKATKNASSNLDRVMQLATNSTDLSSRLDTRVNLLRDEIEAKKDSLKI